MTTNQSQRTKIGIKAVETMPPHSIIWDTAIPGFNARRQNSNVVTHSVVYRTLEGVQRWQRQGRHGVRTPDLARREAQRVLRARDLGEDPAGARMALRTGMTVAQLCDEYCARENGKKPATIKSDNSRIKLHIKPKLGKCPSSDDLRHIAGLPKGGSGSSVIEIMRHAVDAASDGLRLSGA